MKELCNQDRRAFIDKMKKNIRLERKLYAGVLMVLVLLAIIIILTTSTGVSFKQVQDIAEETLRPTKDKVEDSAQRLTRMESELENQRGAITNLAAHSSANTRHGLMELQVEIHDLALRIHELEARTIPPTNQPAAVAAER